jgi:hypothetical protein
MSSLLSGRQKWCSGCEELVGDVIIVDGERKASDARFQVPEIITTDEPFCKR